MTTAFALYLAVGAVLAADAMCRYEKLHAPAHITARYVARCVLAGTLTALLWGPFAVAYLLGDRDA